MAAFNNALTSSVTTATTVYTAPTTGGSVVIGLSVSNTTAASITATVKLFKSGGATSASVVTNAPISIGASLVAAGSDQKLVLKQNDFLQVTASGSADVIVSALEN